MPVFGSSFSEDYQAGLFPDRYDVIADNVVFLRSRIFLDT